MSGRGICAMAVCGVCCIVCGLYHDQIGQDLFVTAQLLIMGLNKK